MKNILNSFIYMDAPAAWGIYFQDSASPQFEGLVELHYLLLSCISSQTPGIPLSSINQGTKGNFNSGLANYLRYGNIYRDKIIFLLQWIIADLK